MRNKLSGVKSVAYCFADEVVDKITLLPDNSVIWQNEFNLNDICTVGLSGCEITEKKVDKQSVYTIKLTYFTQEEPVITRRQLCYIITLVDGSKYLIGDGRRPYTLREVKNNIPSTVTEKRGFTVTITYSSLKNILSIRA